MAFAFLAGSTLYVVAPFSIVRHVAFRREVDRETMLGALSAYLLFGMAFAFTYRFLGESKAVRSSAPRAKATSPTTCSSVSSR